MKHPMFLLLASIVAVIAVACTGAAAAIPVAAPGPPQPTPAPVPVSFPADEGLHDNRLEWWYYSGHLQDEDGNEYGFHFVIFQSKDSYGAVDGEAAPSYAAQFGLTDVASGEHYESARFSTGAQPQDGPGLSGLRVADWTLMAQPDGHAFTANMPEASLALSLTATRPPALHNDIGWLPGPTSGWTYYYSRPRMTAGGTLKLDGRTLAVTGKAWMDHQWGEFFVLGNPAGWQWFGVQLDDGTELMVTESRDVDGNVNALYGSLIDRVGGVTALRTGSPGSPGTDDIELTSSGTWTSPHTGAVYPSGWTIKLPNDGLELNLEPVVADQVITSTRPESAIYWEGKVRVSGTRDGLPVEGDAYVELTGYVVPPPLPWRASDAGR